MRCCLFSTVAVLLALQADGRRAGSTSTNTRSWSQIRHLSDTSTSTVPTRAPGCFDSATTENVYSTAVTFRRGGATTGKSKLSNFKQRAIPAVALLVGLYFLVQKFDAKGLGILLLAISPGLYNEAVSVVLQEAPSAIESAFKWWWFLAFSFASTIPKVLHMFDATSIVADWNLPHVAYLTSYSMIATGFMAWIYCLNAVPDAAVVHFQSAWNELAVYTMGVVFTVLPVTFWMGVLIEHGVGWALYTALLVILNDTMAYLFGFTIGKNPLLPTISPKKTWEGWLGAFVSTVLLSNPLWKLLMKDSAYNKHALVIALFVNVVAPFGGFLASSVKRAGGKKDFGDLIAGHGGLVDRLDCQLLAAPFLYLYLQAAQV